VSSQLSRIKVRNYRSLASVDLETGPVSVFFGPNGSGKSSLLDSLWFVRDCAIRNVDLASSTRSHGIGLLCDSAPDDDSSIAVTLETSQVEYTLKLDLSSGRIDPFPGETLRRYRDDRCVISRLPGQKTAELYHESAEQIIPLSLKEPEKLSLGMYLGFNPKDQETDQFDSLMHNVRLWHSRSLWIHRLKTAGSDSGNDIRLFDRGDNLWSVLRNVYLKQSLDSRWDTILRFMREAFPNFDGIELDQTGPNSVYASFHEKGRSKAILASGVSDGHLQLLLLLTGLFSEGNWRPSILLFDEPEISLHPWAIATFADAVKLATSQWNKQVFIATHSPVLMSQFESNQCFATSVIGGRTRIESIANVQGIQDLLDQYATGSLYMSEIIGGQSAAAMAESIQ
jgi:predicted ATPase